MPGNKNSGRKTPNATKQAPDPAFPKKKAGRPNKIVQSAENSACEILLSPPLPISQSDTCNVSKLVQNAETLAYETNLTEMNSLSPTLPISLKSDTPNVSKLVKRNSTINQDYDNVIGSALEHFPVTKLPTRRVVLQR